MDITTQRFRLRRYRQWLTLLLFLCLAPAVPAQPPANEDDNAWTINADELQFDDTTNSYVGKGHVSVSRGNQTLTADRVQLDQSTNEADAQGHVRLISKGDWLEGDYLHINLDTEKGELTNGSLFSAPNHLYLTGEKIYKTGPASYWAQKANLTSCDDDRPAWKISARDLKITIEGYGFARHAALWAGRVPVMYTPFLAFPVKLERQTGLLTPQIGQSDRKGTEYLQPFFWAINRSSDATFYGHWMSERGLRTGLEYRYIRTPRSLGTLLMEGFTDSKVDDGTGNSSEDWGYTDDGALRPNEDRYWIRAKIDQELPAGINAKLDVDWVSDQDYLQEFKSGLYGFMETRTAFINTFGRDLNDYTDYIRNNRLNLARFWNRYALNMDLSWNDDVVKRRQADTNDTLQQLPVLTFNGTRRQIGASPLFFDLTSSYTYFYRQDGDRGQRTDIHPRLYYPFFIQKGISLEPSVGLRQTAWRVDEGDPGTSTIAGGDYHRSIYDIKLNTKTEFFKVFDVDMAGFDRLKHAITPELDYSYIPEDDQEELPFFDDLDRIERENLVTLSLTNTLTLRRPQAPQGAAAKYDYQSFFRFKISQGFDIYKHNENAPDPFTDLEAEMDLTPGRWVNIDADAAWSYYDKRFNAYNVAARLWDRRGDNLEASYRYTRENLEEDIEAVDSVLLGAQLAVTSRLHLRGSYELNRVDHLELLTSVGLSYQSQCWAVDVDYIMEEEDRSYTAMIHLFGLGSFGN